MPTTLTVFRIPFAKLVNISILGLLGCMLLIWWHSSNVHYLVHAVLCGIILFGRKSNQLTAHLALSTPQLLLEIGLGLLAIGCLIGWLTIGSLEWGFFAILSAVAMYYPKTSSTQI